MATWFTCQSPPLWRKIPKFQDGERGWNPRVGNRSACVVWCGGDRERRRVPNAPYETKKWKKYSSARWHYGLADKMRHGGKFWGWSPIFFCNRADVRLVTSSCAVQWVDDGFSLTMLVSFIVSYPFGQSCRQSRLNKLRSDSQKVFRIITSHSLCWKAGSTTVIRSWCGVNTSFKWKQ